MKDFLGKYEKIQSFLWIWPHLLKKPFNVTLHFLYSVGLVPELAHQRCS